VMREAEGGDDELDEHAFVAEPEPPHAAPQPAAGHPGLTQVTDDGVKPRLNPGVTLVKPKLNSPRLNSG
jgi:hypothetical protein